MKQVVSARASPVIDGAVCSTLAANISLSELGIAAPCIIAYSGYHVDALSHFSY